MKWQDCLGFQIPRHGFWIPGTEFQSLLVGLGFRTPIVSEIPDSKVHDSGFHRQNFSGFRIPRAKLLGFRNPDSLTWGDLFLGLHWRLGTAEPVEPADATQQGYSPSPPMTAQVDLQHFPPNHVHTHVIRPGVRCRLQNGVIGFCVESSIEKVDLRLLIFLQRLCTPVMAFSKARIKKSVKSHKPVRKTYTDLAI